MAVDVETPDRPKEKEMIVIDGDSSEEELEVIDL